VDGDAEETGVFVIFTFLGRVVAMGRLFGKERRISWGEGGCVVLFILLIPLAFFVVTTSVFAKESYFDMSLEQLMNVEVTSASRREQPLSDTAAAVFVITADDLKRTGVTSIPQALRMAPGVQVAKINADNWAVSIRGFNSEFANKLLVLIDARSIYSPISSGVYWDEHLIPLTT